MSINPSPNISIEADDTPDFVVKIEVHPSDDDLEQEVAGLNIPRSGAKRRSSISALSSDAPKKEMLQSIFLGGLPKSPSTEDTNSHDDIPEPPSPSSNLTQPGRLDIGGSTPNMLSPGGAKPTLQRSPSSLFEKLTGAFQKKKTEEVGFDLDDMIKRLIECVDVYSESCVINPEEIFWLCKECTAITLAQPVLIEIEAPLFICGDIHGQFSDLLRVFKTCGDPKNSNYLFLGDYVDRGKQSMETILLQMCYKLKYPETFFLLRGNHECASVNRVYGFYDECKRKSNMKVWKAFTNYFNVLPLAASVAGKIFCVHGGLSPVLKSLKDINDMKRPMDIGSLGLEADLLWSDPIENAKSWEFNEDRGVSYVFGYHEIDQFLSKFKFELICRAHSVVEDGYEFFHNRKLVTLFTAPNYCGKFDNKGAIMEIGNDLKIGFRILDALLKIRRSPSAVGQKNLKD